jgi:hypothetical protein
VVSDADWHNAKKLSKVNIYSVNVNSSTTIGAQVSQFASTLEQAVELFRLAERDGAEYGYTGTRTYAYSEYGNIVGSVRLRNFIVNFVEVHHEVWTMILNGVVVQLTQPELETRLAILVSEDKARPVATAKPNNGGSNTTKPNPTATPAPTQAPSNTPNPQNDSVILPPKYSETETSAPEPVNTPAPSSNKPNPENDVVVLPERSSKDVVEVVNTTSTASTSSSGGSVASWTVQEINVSSTSSNSNTVKEVTAEPTKKASNSSSSSSVSSSNSSTSSVAPAPKNDEVTLVAPVR